MKASTKTTKTTGKKSTETEAASTAPQATAPVAEHREMQRENLRGLVDEARGHLAQLALAFAIADGEGEARSVPEERTREDFNTALAGLAADLYCIVDDHCGGEVST